MSTPTGPVAAWFALAAALAFAPGPRTAPRRLRALAAVGRVGRRATDDPRPAVTGAVPRAASALAGLAGLAVAAVAARAGPALAAALAVVALTAGLLLRDVAARREALRRRRQLLVSTRLLVGELAAGARPATALSAAADGDSPYSPVFEAAAAAAVGGGDAAAILMADTGTVALGTAWRLGTETGAALEGVLARVGDDLAAVDEQARLVAVALAGPRSSAVVLAGLPLVGLGLGIAMGARPLAFLTGSPGGRAVAAAGLLLDALGVLWMRWIVLRAERP